MKTGLAAAMLITATACFAQPYPSKPVRVTVPYAAGGFSDISSRVITEAMSRSLGQPMIVEPRPGGGGRIGAEAIATAAASAATTSGLSPLTVNFTAAGSSDPDGDPLSYAWDFGDGTTGSGLTTSHLYTTNGTHTYMVITEKSLSYDPVKDFTPIAQIGVYGLLMAVHPSIPARNVAEFIDYARRNPGKINFASSGAGSGP